MFLLSDELSPDNFSDDSSSIFFTFLILLSLSIPKESENPIYHSKDEIPMDAVEYEFLRHLCVSNLSRIQLSPL